MGSNDSIRIETTDNASGTPDAGTTSIDSGTVVFDAIAALAVKDAEAKREALRRDAERRERERLTRLAGHEKSAAEHYRSRFRAFDYQGNPPALAWKGYDGAGAGPDAVAHLGLGCFLTCTIEPNESNVIEHTFAVIDAHAPGYAQTVRTLPELAAALGVAPADEQ